MGERERAPPPRTQKEEAAAPLGRKKICSPRGKWRSRSRGCPEMMVSRSLRKARQQLGARAIRDDLPPSFTDQRNILLLWSLSHCPESFIMFQAIRFTARVPLRSVRWSSTGTVLPPLMATMRNDLKTAMRAKDISRYAMLSRDFLYSCYCLLFGRSICCCSCQC